MANSAIKLLDNLRFIIPESGARDQLECHDDDLLVSHDTDGITLRLSAAVRATLAYLSSGGTAALSAVLKMSLGNVTSWLVPQQGSAAIGAGGSASVKTFYSYLRTTDATANQVLDSYTPGNDISGYIEAWVIAINRSTTTEEAVYHIRHAFANRGGTTALVGSVNLLAQEDDAAWAATTNLSSPAVRIVVTGEAAQNIDWFSVTRIVEFSPPT